MNRGLAIGGGIVLALALIIPMAMADSTNGWDDAVVFFLVVLPIAGFAGVLGLVLLIVGLASGERQQQQQQIVVVTGGSYCTGCGQPKGGGAFCTACGTAS